MDGSCRSNAFSRALRSSTAPSESNPEAMSGSEWPTLAPIMVSTALSMTATASTNLVRTWALPVFAKDAVLSALSAIPLPSIAKSSMKVAKAGESVRPNLSHLNGIAPTTGLDPAPEPVLKMASNRRRPAPTAMVEMPMRSRRELVERSRVAMPPAAHAPHWMLTDAVPCLSRETA